MRWIQIRFVLFYTGLTLCAQSPAMQTRWHCLPARYPLILQCRRFELQVQYIDLKSRYDIGNYKHGFLELAGLRIAITVILNIKSLHLCYTELQACVHGFRSSQMHAYIYLGTYVSTISSITGVRSLFRGRRERTAGIYPHDPAHRFPVSVSMYVLDHTCIQDTYAYICIYTHMGKLNPTLT